MKWPNSGAGSQKRQVRGVNSLLSMSVAGSLVVGLMVLLRPVTAKIFPARWQYGMDKIAIIFFLLPVSLLIGKIPWLQPVIPPSHHSQAPSPANGLMDGMDVLVAKHLPVGMMEAILCIWLVGAILLAAWHFYCYRRFSKEIRSDSIPVVEDAKAAALLSSCQAALGIRGKVKLMQNYKITSPMLIGLRHPMILLPVSDIADTDLQLILIHELTHLKRKDLWVKMLALAAETLHWFNPFAHLLGKDVSTWGELSCDEVLASAMSHEERKAYGEAILNTLDICSGIKTAFCSSLCESGKHIERRLMRMLNIKKTKRSIVALSLIITVSLSGMGAYAAYTAEAAVPEAAKSDYLLQGGRNITIESADGTAIIYDKDGKATKTTAKKHPDLKLTDEQKKELEKINEQIQPYLEKGIPTPQVYLDALNRLYGIKPYVQEGNYTPPKLTREELLERIKLHEEKGLPVPQVYLDALNN